jgi:hypothetical protein
MPDIEKPQVIASVPADIEAANAAFAAEQLKRTEAQHAAAVGIAAEIAKAAQEAGLGKIQSPYDASGVEIPAKQVAASSQAGLASGRVRLGGPEKQ